MTSINRNRSKSRSKKSKTSIETDEQIDQIIKDITLKRPRNPFTQFVLSEVDSYKTKNKDAKIDLQEFNQACADKWKKMKDGEKKKYAKLYEDEKVKYKSDLELVKHYLFRDFNDTVYRSPTACVKVSIKALIQKMSEKTQEILGRKCPTKRRKSTLRKKRKMTTGSSKLKKSAR